MTYYIYFLLKKNYSSNFTDKATTTLWRHIQKNHPKIINKSGPIDKYFKEKKR
jgi:hypothetical protein